jgi:hypothetical protein
MPMHDWTRVDPNDYHTFHFAWIAALFHDLNNGRLPTGYYAMADHTTPPIVPDVVTLSTPDAPTALASNPNGAGAIAVLTPPQATIATTASGKPPKPIGRRRVVIKHVRNRQIVAVIEIVSPSNKAKKPEFDDLLGKSVQLLLQGIHVLLIDPFPPTARDPNGIHAAVWKRLTRKPFTPPACKPITFASYVARGANTFSAFVEPLAVGDRLPDMPLFLTSELHVPTPLEETYQIAWQGFPAPLRAIVAGSP